MKRFSGFLFIVFTSMVLYFCYSCKNKNKDEKTGLQKELTESVVSADSVIIKNAQKQFDVFFNYLKSSDYKNCIKMFKAELLTSPGEEALINGLSNRNASMGIPDNFKIIYNYVDYPAQSDTVFYFIIRSFSRQGGMCYERIGLENVQNNFVIGLYEYSPVPYCDVKMANDNRSEVYKAIKTLYGELNKKDYEKVIDLVDETILQKQGRDNLLKMVKDQVKDYNKISDFVVRSVNVEMLKGTIHLDLVVDAEDDEKSVFTENISFVDRNGILKIVWYKRQDKTEAGASGKTTLTDEEYGKFKKEVGNFYQNLGSNNLDAIMSKIDKSVFKSNDYNTVKNSFANRNAYYGIPVDTKKISHEVKSLDGMTIVEFYYEVSNSNGIKSYEKVSVAYSTRGEFLLYGYDYSDKALK